MKLSGIGLLCASFMLLLSSYAGATGVIDLMERPALTAAAPAHAVLLDIARAGKRLIAVGERGLIVISDDQGKSWRQVKVPTSVSLTGVCFPDTMQGWTIGHAGTILHSEDNGESWSRQLDGITAARLALDAAQALVDRDGSEDEQASRQLQAAQYLVEDGPDKPFLDLAFIDEKNGFVVGAYNLIFHTTDGGKSWQPWLERVENPQGLHLNAIEIVGDTIYLAGEQGLFLRSTDAGQHFHKLPTPYEGTYFVISADNQGNVVLGGLRGNVFRSSDRGETFTQSKVPLPVSLSAIARGPENNLFFANQAGQLLVSYDGGRSLTPLSTPRLPPLASLMVTEDNTLLTTGWGGVIPVPLSPSNPAGGKP